jgi:hypothetical protein
MRFRLQYILLILVLINSMGYDWLHTLWHHQNGPRLYQLANTETDILTNSLDDRLVDTSQPGNSELSASEISIGTLFFNPRLFEPDPEPVEENGIAGFPLALFKPPRIIAVFV